ncbi:MAG: glycosyltransferase family 2 protein [Pseudomonadota bacterium]
MSTDLPHKRLCVQSVIYQLPMESIERTLEYLDVAALNARNAGGIGEVVIALGDCSPEPALSEAHLEQLRSRFENLGEIAYHFFDANLGSAAGHNELLARSSSDFSMILNPDVLAAPNLLIEMFKPFGEANVGFVEARQMPIEHPKSYDLETGDTSWASTACAVGPRHVFDEVNGFDSETFFLYGDDVDFSWRVRLQGYRVVYRPTAVIFHDKRLGQSGNWMVGAAEKYYSAEAGIYLPYKYSRPDLAEQAINYFKATNDEALHEVVEKFEDRKKKGTLPEQLDPEHRVAEFVDGAYAKHRY